MRGTARAPAMSINPRAPWGRASRISAGPCPVTNGPLPHPAATRSWRGIDAPMRAPFCCPPRRTHFTTGGTHVRADRSGFTPFVLLATVLGLSCANARFIRPSSLSIRPDRYRTHSVNRIRRTAERQRAPLNERDVRNRSQHCCRTARTTPKPWCWSRDCDAGWDQNWCPAPRSLPASRVRSPPPAQPSRRAPCASAPVPLLLCDSASMSLDGSGARRSSTPWPGRGGGQQGPSRPRERRYGLAQPRVVRYSLAQGRVRLFQRCGRCNGTTVRLTGSNLWSAPPARYRSRPITAV